MAEKNTSQESDVDDNVPMEFYRSSAVGVALIATLNSMMENKSITEDFALKILDNFDSTFQSTLREHLYIKRGHHTMIAEGKVGTYNEVRDLWKIDGEDVTLEMEGNVDSKKTYKRARFLFTK